MLPQTVAIRAAEICVQSFKEHPHLADCQDRCRWFRYSGALTLVWLLCWSVAGTAGGVVPRAVAEPSSIQEVHGPDASAFDEGPLAEKEDGDEDADDDFVRWRGVTVGLPLYRAEEEPVLGNMEWGSGGQGRDGANGSGQGASSYEVNGFLRTGGQGAIEIYRQAEAALFSDYVAARTRLRSSHAAHPQSVSYARKGDGSSVDSSGSRSYGPLVRPWLSYGSGFGPWYGSGPFGYGVGWF